MVKLLEASPTIGRRYQPKARRATPGQGAGITGCASDCVFALLESGIADCAQTFQETPQGADIGPGDIIRQPIEMLGTEGSEAGEDRVNFGLAGNEGGKRGTVA